MARAARIEQHGGPEVIQWIDIDLPDPAEDQVRIRSTAVGLNFIEIYQRSGLYPLPLPSGLGSESVGVIEALGPGVTGFAVGDRVGTFGPVIGSYATHRNLPAATLVKLPDSIDDRNAAAILLKGGTTEFLIERCAKVQAGQTVLLHAAAGGVGHLAVGWLKAIGATVIGTVGSPEKAERARRAGADHVIEYKRDDIVARVREITGGAGADVALDGVGKDSWEASLKSVRPRGIIVSYGNASGPVTGVDLGVLARNGSLFVTRPTMFDYYATPEESAAGFARVFEMLANGAISPDIGQTFALEDAAEAHRRLTAGQTEGATVLLP